MSHKPALSDTFNKYFDIKLADTPELLREVYALRQQVYCIENQYEPLPTDDAGERDDYDSRAKHSIVRHRSLGIAAATVRLVLPSARLTEPLPIWEHSAANMSAHADLLREIPTASTAEISLFAVSKHFKRRLGEAQSVAGVASDLATYSADQLMGGRLIPHITLGLFTAIVRMSAQNDITHWYAVMEPALLRLLSRFGIVFRPIGGIVTYHGERQPCFASVDEILLGIWYKRPDIWALITDNGQAWALPESVCKVECRSA